MGAIRVLKKTEIECRVSQCGMGQYGAWCTVLLYKDARVDMRILDEVYGPNNWQREHTMIGDRLYCTISIWDDEKKQWIKKQDVGTESNAEPEKGQASDAFKRAGFNVGIGRELYTAPFIRIPLNDGEFKVDKDRNGKDKVTTYIKFDVSDISHNNDGSIKEVVIVDEKGVIRFPKYKTNKAASSQPAPQPAASSPQAPAKKRIVVGGKAWHSAVEKHAKGEDMTDAMEERYNILDAEWDMFFEAVNTYKRENNIK